MDPNKLATLERLHIQVMDRILQYYVQACYPSMPLDDWQITVCNELQEWVEAIERQESPRLEITASPQTGKSVIVARAFIAWLIGRHPKWPGIIASYAGLLATGHGRWIRNQLNSELHKKVFPNSLLSQDSQSKDTMTTEAGGQIIARGIGGGTTGNPAMFFIIDDPFADRAEAESIVIRDTVDAWYTSVATTRLGPGAGILLMNTRWHIDDLSGRLALREEEGKDDRFVDKWKRLSFPAEWLPGVTADKKYYIFEPDGSGWLKCRFRPDDFRRKKANLPPRDWLSMFQQTPTQAGGQIILASWIKEDRWPKGWKPKVYQAWDLAGTKQDLKDGGCYSVGVAVCLDWMMRWWLVDVVRGKWDGGELVEQILSFGHKWKALKVWGEDPIALYLESFINIRMMQTGKHIAFERANVQGRGDKVARVQASLVPVMRNGSFYVPRGVVWLKDLKTELGLFPQGYKDTADALSLVFAEAMPFAIPSPAPASEAKVRDPRIITWDDLTKKDKPEKRSVWTR